MGNHIESTANFVVFRNDKREYRVGTSLGSFSNNNRSNCVCIDNHGFWWDVKMHNMRSITEAEHDTMITNEELEDNAFYLLDPGQDDPLDFTVIP